MSAFVQPSGNLNRSQGSEQNGGSSVPYGKLRPFQAGTLPPPTVDDGHGGQHGDPSMMMANGGPAHIRRQYQLQRQQQQQQQQQMVANLPLIGQDRSFLRRSQPHLPYVGQSHDIGREMMRRSQSDNPKEEIGSDSPSQQQQQQQPQQQQEEQVHNCPGNTSSHMQQWPRGLMDGQQPQGDSHGYQQLPQAQQFSYPVPRKPSGHLGQAQPALLSAQQQQLEKQQILSATHQPEPQSRGALLMVEVAQLQELCEQELQAVKRFGEQLMSCSSSLSDSRSEQTINDFRTLLVNRIWQKKSRALAYICEGVGGQSLFSLSNSRESVSLGPLNIIQQPSEMALVNRYIIPSPKLVVNGTMAPSSSLFVSARIVYHDEQGKEVEKTMDRKQNLLQGNLRVPVDSAGYVHFNKLKIMEVSRKHALRAFCLQFTLEQVSNSGETNVIAAVCSVPFNVQSRPNKRPSSSMPFHPAKRMALSSSGADMGHVRFSGNVSTEQVIGRRMPMGIDRSLPSLPNRWPAHQSTGNLAGSSMATRPAGGLPRVQGGGRSGFTASKGLSPLTPGLKNAQRNPKSRSVDSMIDFNYIDITQLLSLPQKEAAKRLGISESMLCKRFKESTSRKWPYRYLRKIEKVISVLEGQKEEGALSEDDDLKLAKLLGEREDCLQPVRIRITSYDKVGSRHMRLSSQQGLAPLQVTLKKKQGAAFVTESKEVDEDTSDVVQTLQTMKDSREHLPAPRAAAVAKESPKRRSPLATEGRGRTKRLPPKLVE